jgi:hypothetical protein
VALLLAAVYATPLAAILDVAPPDAVDWLVIFTMSLLPLVAGQAWMLLQRSPASSR